MDQVFLQALLLADSTIRLATPLVLAALAGLFCERSGVVDIALEGKMLGGAFAAAATAAVTGSAWLGLFAAIGFGVGLAMVHGFACITHRGNQVVSGMALNIAVAGLGPTLASAWFGQAGRTPLLGEEARFTPIDLPLARELSGVPILGPIYSELISGHNLLVYLAAVVVPLVAWVVYRTRFGLRLRAVGENPSAVDTAGISVSAMRYQALIVTGVLCGIAGAYLSTAHNASFIRDMTAGRADLRQVAAGAGAARLPSVRLHGRRADPPPGHPAAAGRHGAYPGNPGAALSPDRAAARRLRRPRGRAQRDRTALREGAVRELRLAFRNRKSRATPLRPRNTPGPCERHGPDLSASAGRLAGAASRRQR
jgi:general nucleoside transport system permease protein